MACLRNDKALLGMTDKEFIESVANGDINANDILKHCDIDGYDIDGLHNQMVVWCVMQEKEYSGKATSVIDRERIANVEKAITIVEALKVTPLQATKHILGDYYRDEIWKHFQKAMEAGLMKFNGTTFKWEKSKALLAYFLERIFIPKAKDKSKIPESALNRLFGVDRIGKARSQLCNNLGNGKPRGYKNIDVLFDDEEQP